jgi:hypothetical protein
MVVNFSLHATSFFDNGRLHERGKTKILHLKVFSWLGIQFSVYNFFFPFVCLFWFGLGFSCKAGTIFASSHNTGWRAFMYMLKKRKCMLTKALIEQKRLYSKVVHTCVFAASLESLKSGHVCSKMYLVEDISITSPATNSRCQLSELTA